jgi:hypothetical protein
MAQFSTISNSHIKNLLNFHNLKFDSIYREDEKNEIALK